MLKISRMKQVTSHKFMRISCNLQQVSGKKIFCFTLLASVPGILLIKLTKDRLRKKVYDFYIHRGLHRKEVKNPKEVVKLRGLSTILIRANKLRRKTRQRKLGLGF